MRPIRPLEKSFSAYLTEYTADCPDERVYFSEDYAVTLGMFYAAVHRTAEDLEDAGVRRQQYAALCGTRAVEAVVFFYALQELGAVVVMCDPHETAAEYIARSGTGIVPDHIVDFRDGTWTVDGQPYVISYEEKETYRSFGPADVRQPAVVIFTSGSTGKNKGVLLSQYNLVNHQRNFKQVGGHTDHDSSILMLPIFHIFGLTQIIDGIMHRCPVFFPREVTPDYVCAQIERYRFTRFGFVPSFALAMAQAKARAGYDTDSLVAAVLAGAPSTREQFRYIEQTLGVTIVPVYGMSECPGISGSGPEEPAEYRAGSVGKILPMADVKISDDGEITVKGPSLFIGYAGEPPFPRDRYFPTGDLGYIDDLGFLHVTGRKKDIIIRNGNNLSAAAIENRLLSLPFVETAAVVGIRDEACGEVPAAMLTLKAGCAFDQEAVRACLTKIEMPAKVVIAERLPLNAAGKVDKVTIREMLS
ncbi:MAG: acyl--CoA ligase [Lachnospiraceae bacterium]|nr:acyl--CoA ligase [Lachnospiraceae bacterium]